MNTLFLYWEHGWQLAGWTMVYYLAVGSLVALSAAAARWLLRSADPEFRYATSLAVFATLALMPVGIAIWLSQSTAGGIPLTSLALPSPPPVVDLAIDPAEGLSQVAESMLPTSLPQSDIVVVPAATAWSMARVIEYMPWVWLIGTPLTFVLLATGLIGAERLRCTSQIVTEGPAYDAVQRLRVALGVGQTVAIAICERIATPLMVGIVRPLILLPPAALAGWSTDELEMVLLHELAHVRRWDNLVNLLQRIVESLLFFHPAVWLVSHWVRLDREDCCDAVVVSHTAKPQVYAELLVALASTSQPLSQPLAGVALARHPLAGRIHRILHLEDETMLVSRNTLVAISTALLAMLLAVSNYNPRETEADDATGRSTTEDTENTEQEALAEDVTNRLEGTLQSAVQRIRQLRVEGKRIALKLNDDDTLAVVAQGAGQPEALSEGAANNLLMKLLFEPSETNRVALRVYEIPEFLRTYPGQLGDVFEGLEKDPFGPQIKFDWEYTDGGKHVSISAPKLGLWFWEHGFAQIEKQFEGLKPVGRVVPAPGSPEPPSPFPTLEEQRAADVAYKLLNAELEALTAGELERVRDQGFEGGLRVAAVDAKWERGLRPDDLLVGLHVWPTESLDDMQEILTREDIGELSPLKFYVVRAYGEPSREKGIITKDRLITGRVAVNLDAWRSIRKRKNPQSVRSVPDSMLPQELLQSNQKAAEMLRKRAKKPVEPVPAEAAVELERVRAELKLAREKLKALETELQYRQTQAQPSEESSRLVPGVQNWKRLSRSSENPEVLKKIHEQLVKELQEKIDRFTALSEESSDSVGDFAPVMFNIPDKDVRVIQQQIIQKKQELLDIEVMKTLAVQQANSPTALEAAIQEEMNNDPMFQSFQQEQYAVTQQMTQLKAITKRRNSPEMKRLQEHLSTLGQQIQEYRLTKETELRERFKSAPNDTLAQMMSEYMIRRKSAEAHLAELQRRYKEKVEQLQRKGQSWGAQAVLEKEITQLQEVERALDQKLRSWEADQAANLLQPGDTVLLRVRGALPEEPLDDDFKIESMGTIALGPTYGRVEIAGRNVLEAEQIVKEHLSEILENPKVQLTLRMKATQPPRNVPRTYFEAPRAPAEPQQPRDEAKASP